MILRGNRRHWCDYWLKEKPICEPVTAVKVIIIEGRFEVRFCKYYGPQCCDFFQDHTMLTTIGGSDVSNRSQWGTHF